MPAGMHMAAELNPRQSSFVAEYVKDPNATQAAIRAGYSKRSAQQTSARLMSNDVVREAIMAALRTRTERTGIDAAWLLSRLGELADVDVTSIMTMDARGRLKLKPIEDMTDASRRLIASAKDGEVKLLDRLKVLELIGRHVNVAAFSENIRHELGDDLMDRLERARKRAAKR